MIDCNVFPVVSKDQKRLIGAMSVDHTLNHYEFHIDVLIDHSDVWTCYRNEIFDISTINSANWKLFKLAKLWPDIIVKNNNPLWKELDPVIKCEEMDKVTDDVMSYGERADAVHRIADVVAFNESKETMRMLEYMKQRGVDVFVFSIPRYDELPHTDDEEYRHKNGIIGFMEPCGGRSGEQLKKVYADCYDLKERGQIGGYLKQVYRNGITRLADYHSTYTNVYDGRRYTVGQNGRNRHMHFYGPCTIGGAFVPDSLTIPSIVQSRINETGAEYDVINYGTLGFYRTYVNKMKKSGIRQGDMVIVVDHYWRNEWISEYPITVVSLKDAYLSGPKDMYFEDPSHMSSRGNRVLSDYIFKCIEKSLKYDVATSVANLISLDGFGDNTTDISSDITEWAKTWINAEIKDDDVVGSIVMNCNPFTYGHKYLIEKALKEVDYLYIFVVEEDKSFFSFEDRYDMVKSSCREYNNVSVVPSGKWVLSNATLPEYFSKEENRDQVVCSADDLEMFGSEIARMFHISRRFVGEEINDIITRQYNDSMKRILPEYGVELIEIPRKNIDGRAISASTVRRYIKNRNFEGLKCLVPEYTYEVIMKKYAR